jgi:AbrB family looped-hinge helix DNA binding protein
MTVVTISSRYQIVIPKDVRERLALTPGQQLQALAHEGRIELIPIRPMSELRGSMPGLDTAVEREGERG